MLSLEGRAALVTGGAKRIGRAIALALGRAGAEVVVHYRNSAGEAEEVAAAIRNAGGTATTLAGDLAEAQGCVALFERALSQAGRMDILVNSASLFEESRLGSLTEAEVIRQLEVNTLAPLELSRRFAAHVRSRAGNGGPAWKGSIVNLLDSRIVDYDRSHLAYALSKRALFSLGRMMAIEFAPEVRVNAVAPGLILPPAGKDESYVESLRESNPLRSIGTVEEIAESVLFLAGTEFITGQVLFIDGGRHLKGSFYGA